MKSVKFKTKNELVLNHPAIHDVLIYDIETDSLNTDTAKCKFFGCYSYKHEKYFICHQDEKEAIQSLISDHKILVGYNNKNFDGPIMENRVNNFDLNYKVCFDGLQVLYNTKRRKINREWDIRIPQDYEGHEKGTNLLTVLKNRKLSHVGEVLGLSVAKGDIDYAIFQKDRWTDIELKDIHTYLYKDVVLTRELFEFYVEAFEPFKEYVDDKNIMKFDYIRSSLGSYSYSAICHLCDMEPEYEDNHLKLQERPLNEGGFVLEPQVPYAENVVYADWASLYPHILFMCNLYCPVSDDTPGSWKGGNMFDLQSSYKGDKPGKIEVVLKDIYNKRRKYKAEGNLRQYALKIMINTLYGISGSPIFKNVYTPTTSGDCTKIGRQLMKYAKGRFDEQGFRVVYGDTDSCFIVIPKGKTIDDYRDLAKIIRDEILAEVPFPADTFKFDIDDIFKKVWLFKKKHYIGINSKNQFVIKGMDIKKHDATKLSQLILEEIKPLILAKQDIKFSKKYIDSLIERELAHDLTIVARVYNVKRPDEYKSKTSIQAQIAREFGSGTHLLVANNKLGNVGKTKKYATLEQAKTLRREDLDLTKLYNELDPFIEPVITQKKL